MKSILVFSRLAIASILMAITFQASASPTVRVLVAFTAAASLKAINDGGISAMVNYKIDTLNSVLHASGSNMNVELAETIVIGGLSWKNAFDALIGVQDDIYTLVAKDKYDADIVMLIMYSSSNPDPLGAAAQIPANAGNPFAVVEYAAAASAHTFEHEFGHLFGARHEFSSDSNIRPYIFGHAWVGELSTIVGNQVNWFCYQTVMSSIPPYARRVSHQGCNNGLNRYLSLDIYSTPDIKFFGVDPYGDVFTANNALVFSRRASTVAEFRETKLSHGRLAAVVTFVLNLLD